MRSARKHRIAALLAVLCASRGIVGSHAFGTAPSDANTCRRRPTDRDDGVLRLGMLLPLTGWAAGRYILGAATLAVEEINSSPLLRGRCVEYEVEDEGCKAIIGTTALSRLLQKYTIHAVIGASCSVACLPTGYLSAGSHLPQVSNGCSAGHFGSPNRHTHACQRLWTLEARVRSVVCRRFVQQTGVPDVCADCPAKTALQVRHSWPNAVGWMEAGHAPELKCRVLCRSFEGISSDVCPCYGKAFTCACSVGL
jgi:hypothetical protein